MQIDYTPEERRHIEAIQQDYEQRTRSAADDRERVALLLMKAHELSEYNKQCLQIRFDKLGGDLDAIRKDAEEKINRILIDNYEGAVKYITPEEDKELDLHIYGDCSSGKLCLDANYAADVIRSELSLHIDALKQDEAALRKLFAYMVGAIENSEYTDGAEITIPETSEAALDILRYRRAPLTDLKTFGLMSDKASAQILQDGDLFQQTPDGQWTMRWPINQATEKNPVPVYIAMVYEGAESKITKRLTGFDKAVYDAIGTRFYYWKRQNPQKPLYITPQEIWRTMNGKKSGDGKANPGKAQVRRICASMDKMRYTRFIMDITEEIKAKRVSIDDERVVSGKIESYLLNSSKVEFETDKGNIVIGYRISEEPILYTYSAAKNHLLYVPYDMLDTSANTSDGENVTEFKFYLLQQIQLMKNAEESQGKKKYFKRNNIILLSTIYKSTGIPTPEERAAAASFTSEQARQTYLRKTRKADRGKIEGLLDSWKASGRIRGYTVLNGQNEPAQPKQQAKGYQIDV